MNLFLHHVLPILNRKYPKEKMRVQEINKVTE
jgi:hypothetical protein